jgi:hypothetical protein
MVPIVTAPGILMIRCRQRGADDAAGRGGLSLHSKRDRQPDHKSTRGYQLSVSFVHICL